MASIDIEMAAASQLLTSSAPPPKPRGVLRLTVDVPFSTRPERDAPARPPARWRTPEYLFYFFVLACGLWQVIVTAMRLSDSTY